MARTMSDSHRRFLQTMMGSRITEVSKARALHRHCCELHRTQYARDGLEEFINVINSHLQPLFMQIRKGTSEDDGLQYYALVNMAETEVTRMSSDYADNELELFRKTMDLIVESENGTASSTDILNCADSLKTRKMKKKETEQVLQRLVQDKWLSEKHGEYALSTRCIMEMEQYILKMYEDLVKKCHLCHNIALQGQICDNSECSVKMHMSCVAKYFRGRTDPQCPACKEFWPHEIPEITTPGESSTDSVSPMDTATPSTSGSQSRRRR